MPLLTPLGILRPFFTDDCGRFLSGGKVFTYEENSLTPKNTFTNPDGNTPNTNPIILDGAGSADIFLNGNYRFQIFSRNGVLVRDINSIKELHTKEEAFLELMSSTSFAEPSLIFGLYVAEKSFVFAKDYSFTASPHVAFSDTKQPIKVGVYKNDNLICEIDFSENSSAFNFLEEVSVFEKGDVLKLQLLNFHYSVKNIAVTLVGKFPIYTVW
ncbi:hypothetical protein BEN74_18815 [Acinetobacter sp. WCHAc010034]|uniref:hypothetical protein n=1 Tax=Acinetobacter sp. WCHAc010034 TaxID=1879049 RepID=UPI000839F2F4|nr:hypothetical protein [Acinetobacter sp. WCHAc010034]AYA04633.1 hypothetical protein BEN74_18815 [Acinetobacter sp. WCHAc010034]